MHNSIHFKPKQRYIIRGDHPTKKRIDEKVKHLGLLFSRLHLLELEGYELTLIAEWD